MKLELTESDIEKDPTRAGWTLEEFARTAEESEIESEAGFGVMLNRIPRMRRMILGAAIRALAAERSLYDRGNARWITEPDWSSRLKAVVWLSSYSDGLPTQTTLAVHVGDRPDAATDIDLEAAVARSPALRERLEKLLGARTAKALPK